MDNPLIVQGLEITDTLLGEIRRTLDADPTWTRRGLSRYLCELWNWRNGKGVLKDMACRTLLRKLAARGLVVLPQPRTTGYNDRRNSRAVGIEVVTDPIEASLCQVQPLCVHCVHGIDPDREVFRTVIARYHYLGLQNTVGENLKYLVRDRHDRVIACLLFGSAAWKMAGRDAFIGWSAAQRARNLQLLTNNTRFLIPPWVRVPHLASHVLALICRRLSDDWCVHYGHPILAVETFVDTSRFRGTCYRAANWRFVGTTTGRTRNDRYNRIQQSPKDCYLLPLHPHFTRRLCE